MSYMDGFVIPVPRGRKQDYQAWAAYAAPIFIEYGALRVVECWSDDIKPGKVNDLRTAVIAEKNEDVVFSWVEWPDKATRDLGAKGIMMDHRMQSKEEDMPFGVERLIYGGFDVMLDVKA